MRKKEFFTVLAQKNPDLSHEQINRLGNRMVNTLMKAMHAGNRIEIRGFGSFFVRTCKTRLLRNPRTNEIIEIPLKRIPRFKAGKPLKEKANRPTKPPTDNS